MGEPLLQTKLYAPPVKKPLVSRSHLIDKLNSGLNRRLTLISAPAGFGKSTLVSAWLSQVKRPYGWVSLDKEDNDVTRLFSYSVVAIQPIQGMGHSARRLLESDQPIATETMVTAFVNDCLSATTPLILVLDDYHHIIETAINEAVSYLIDNMPENLHLVLISRVDPMLPISRLRAIGQLNELRMEDLRFSPDEAENFLNHVMRLKVTEEQVSALETRTEGWIAGLQMAGFSIQRLHRKEEISEFVSDFTGSHRYIFDYLTDEVLNQQDQEMKDFLVETSILDRFNASLCKAVTGQNDSKTILNHLEKTNMFLTSLDENREWYRYHHLFADLLKQRLVTSNPEKAPELYHRASQWFAENGEVAEAVSYALEGGHAEQAAGWLDREAFKIIGRSEHRKLFELLRKLPADVQSKFPRLGVAEGWLYMFFAEYDLAEEYLKRVEARLTSGFDISPEFPADLAKAYIAMIRAYSATRQGLLSDAIRYSEDSLAFLENIPEENARELRCSVLLNLGQTQAAMDDLENAKKTYSQAIIDSQASQRVSAVLASYTCLMLLERKAGRLGAARSVGHQGLSWLKNFVGSRGQNYSSEGEIRIQLVLICYEQNRLEQAKAHLSRCLDLYQTTSNQRYVECLHYLFLVLLAEGELEKAIEIHQEIIPIFKDFPPKLYQRYLANFIDQILRLSRIQPDEIQWQQELRLWLPSFDVHAEETINTRQEPQLLVKAKVLRATGALEEALSLLEFLENAAESASRYGDLIQYRIQQAMVLKQLSRQEDAVELINQAFSLAQSENFIRTFLDQEAELNYLIYLVPETPYRNEIISQFRPTSLSPVDLSSKKLSNLYTVDPLSLRELEVLGLLTSHLTGPEIADQLNISINTYKTHTRKIYSKLGVNSRNEAVEISKKLGLL